MFPVFFCPDADLCSLRASHRVVADAQQLSQPVDQYQYQSKVDIHTDSHVSQPQLITSNMSRTPAREN